jgi:hypothetical protein
MLCTCNAGWSVQKISLCVSKEFSMRFKQRTPLAMVIVAFVFAGLAFAPTMADAKTKKSALVGKKVTVIFSTNSPNAISSIDGTVSDADPMGLELRATSRSYADRTVQAYKHTLFIPWSAILYVKIL